MSISTVRVKVQQCNYGALLACIVLYVLLAPAYAQNNVLQGNVEESEQAQTRLHRFDISADKSVGTTPPPTRIHRSPQSLSPESADTDPEAFAVKPADQYDLETEANSRELMLAWELWHKQLTKAVYDRSHPFAIGACAYRITVTWNNRLNIKVLRSWGDPMVTQNVVAAAQSLDGNIGLSFPEGSHRKVASDTHVMISGPNIKPGYEWDKSDFEKVHQEW